MSSVNSYLLFLSKQESIFVLDPLVALSNVNKVPDLRSKTSFRSVPMLNALVAPFLKEEMSISKHTFDLRSDTKLTVAMQSEMPLDFDRKALKAFYSESGLDVYFLAKNADGNFLLRNLLTGKELVIASDSALFNRLMSEVFDLWKIIYANEFGNNCKLLKEKDKTGYILELAENIIAYARSKKCNKAYCHFLTRETRKQ